MEVEVEEVMVEVSVVLLEVVKGHRQRINRLHCTSILPKTSSNLAISYLLP